MLGARMDRRTEPPVEDKQRIIDLIETAKRDVTDAETELGKLLGEIEVQARSHKTTVSAVVDSSFVKLRAARRILSDLEEIVKASDG